MRSLRHRKNAKATATEQPPSARLIPQHGKGTGQLAEREREREKERKTASLGSRR